MPVAGLGGERVTAWSCPDRLLECARQAGPSDARGAPGAATPREPCACGSMLTAAAAAVPPVPPQPVARRKPIVVGPRSISVVVDGESHTLANTVRDFAWVQ